MGFLDSWLFRRWVRISDETSSRIVNALADNGIVAHWMRERSIHYLYVQTNEGTEAVLETGPNGCWARVR